MNHDAFRCLGDFLEAAAMAGHTGAIVEGVQMTLRASHAFSVACADAVEAGEHVERAYIWADALAFREIALTLEVLIADVDRRGAQLYRFQAATGGDENTAPVDLRRALAGDARAGHAQPPSASTSGTSMSRKPPRGGAYGSIAPVMMGRRSSSPPAAITSITPTDAAKYVPSAYPCSSRVPNPPTTGNPSTRA